MVILVPLSYPAGIAVRTCAIHAVAEVSVFARRTHLLAVFSKKAVGTLLVTPRAVPAPVAGYTETLCYLAGLLAFTVATPTDRKPHSQPHRCGTLEKHRGIHTAATAYAEHSEK